MFHISEDEKVLLETGDIEKRFFKAIIRGTIYFIFISGIFLIVIDLFYFFSSKVSALLIITFIIIFILGVLCFPFGLFFLRQMIHKKRTRYYLTNKRVVKYTEKGFFSRKPKISEIDYQNVSHVIEWTNAITILVLESFDEIDNFETDRDFFKYYQFYEQEGIHITLNGLKGAEILQKITMLLKDSIPLTSHKKFSFLLVKKS